MNCEFVMNVVKTDHSSKIGDDWLNHSIVHAILRVIYLHNIRETSGMYYVPEFFNFYLMLSCFI